MKVETFHEQPRVGAQSPLQDLSVDSSVHDNLSDHNNEDSESLKQSESFEKLEPVSDSAHPTSTIEINPGKILDALDPFSPKNSGVSVYIPSALYHAVIQEIYPAFFEDEEAKPKVEARLALLDCSKQELGRHHGAEILGTEETINHPPRSSQEWKGKRLRMHGSIMQRPTGTSMTNTTQSERAGLPSSEVDSTSKKEDTKPPAKRNLTDLISSIVSQYAQEPILSSQSDFSSISTSEVSAHSVENPAHSTHSKIRILNKGSKIRMVGTVSLPDGPLKPNKPNRSKS